MLKKKDFNLICRWRVILMTAHMFNVHMMVLITYRVIFQFELRSVCAFNILLNN